MVFPAILDTKGTRFRVHTKLIEPPVRPTRRKKGREPRTEVQLLFDSLLAPALGRRCAAFTQRHLLYRTEPYQVDLLIEMHPESSRLIVTGQLLDTSQPAMISRGANVRLSNGRQSIVSLETNEFGEFWGEIENSGELAVSLKVHDREFAISIREVLGSSPPGC